MIEPSDGRVPIRFGPADAAGPDEALLVEGEAPISTGRAVALFRLSSRRPGHPLRCACCAPRTPVAEALSRLFLARARGEVAFFHSVVAVVATQAGETAVQAALAEDQVSAWRFRLAQR